MDCELMELTRRSFLKGLLVLSASAAIPIELVKMAEVAYSDDAITKTPPLYILINGEILPIHGLIVEQPMRDINRVYIPAGINKYQVVSSILNPPDLPTVNIKFLSGNIDSYLMKLQEFDFEIHGDRLPYVLSGRGWTTTCSTEPFLISSDEPRYTKFEFTAEMI